MALISSTSASSRSRRKRSTCSTGPKTSRSSSAMLSISMSVGATKLPWRQASRQRQGVHRPAPSPASPRHGPRCRAAPPRRSPGRHRWRGGRGCRRSAPPWRPAAWRAPGRPPPPAGRARAAPSSAGRRCRRPRRSTSPTTCSGRAELSTTSAFCPPVSAISGTVRPSGLSRSASWRWISRATSVEPVNITPRTRGSATSAAPTSPAPGRSCTAPGGTPGLAQQAHGLRRRSAASPPPAWRARGCRPPAPPRPGR